VRLKKLLSAFCGALAALALFAIMLLTLVDVSGRKFISTSVPGSLELTELLMVVVIFAALPLVSLRGEHVVFDSLDRFLPPWLRRLQRRVVEGLCAAGLVGIAWLMWVKAGHMADYGDITSQLQLPLAPFVRLMGALCAAAALVHLLLLLKPAPEHPTPGAGA
jgi:TRAP-type C4-dicarboxylate transport system permease small subunit